MTANKPEMVLYRAPTFSPIASHGGISSCAYITSREGNRGLQMILY